MSQNTINAKKELKKVKVILLHFQCIFFFDLPKQKSKNAWEALIKKKATKVEFQGWVENTNVSETNDFTSEAMLGDNVIGHSGTDESKELDDYIDKAEKAK